MAGSDDNMIDPTRPDENPKNKKVGSLVVAVICLGALYVAYSMYVQFDEHSNNQFRSAEPSYSEQSRAFLKPRENPYLTALLSPAAPSRQDDQSERLLQQIERKFGNLRLEARLSRSNFSDPKCLKFFKDIESAYKSSDYQGGLKTVGLGLAYCQDHPDVQKITALDLLLLGIKLAHKTGQFDLARLYVDRGLTMARQFQDYKMDDFEGLSCMLGGNLPAAEQYQKLLARFNENLEQDKKEQLAGISDALVKDTAALGEGNFFRLNAQLSRAVSLCLGQKENQARAVLKELRAAADKVHDLRLVTVCDNLYDNIGKPR